MALTLLPCGRRVGLTPQQLTGSDISSGQRQAILHGRRGNRQLPEVKRASANRPMAFDSRGISQSGSQPIQLARVKAASCGQLQTKSSTFCGQRSPAHLYTQWTWNGNSHPVRPHHGSWRSNTHGQYIILLWQILHSCVTFVSQLAVAGMS